MTACGAKKSPGTRPGRFVDRGRPDHRRAKNTSATTRAAVPATRQRRGSVATTHATISNGTLQQSLGLEAVYAHWWGVVGAALLSGDDHHQCERATRPMHSCATKNDYGANLARAGLPGLTHLHLLGIGVLVVMSSMPMAGGTKHGDSMRKLAAYGRWVDRGSPPRWACRSLGHVGSKSSAEAMS
jgi:hypothetical protein